MVILSLFKSAFKSLTINRWRAFLTMLGIIIGVAGVIVILSVGAGAQSLILNQIEGIGSNLISIIPGASDDEGPPAALMGIVVTTLMPKDLEALLNDVSLPEIEAASGYARGMATLQWQNRKNDVTYEGVSVDYPIVEGMTLSKGRFFTEVENRGTAKLMIIGHEVANDIFGSIDPINQKVKLRREIFRIIGVANERGSTFLGNPDKQVYIPLQTSQKILLGINHLNFIRLKIDSGAVIEDTIENIKMVIREQHNIIDSNVDDFAVKSQAQALDILGSITDALKFFLAAIAAIALLVGGIGIMNIMLVSVTERTAEIGLRKAVGAKSSIIVLQFLVEAITITFIGGLVGIFAGGLISGLIALVAKYLGYHWSFIISLTSILVSTGIAISIGIFFGLYPAIQAAKLDPVEALRYE